MFYRIEHGKVSNFDFPVCWENHEFHIVLEDVNYCR